MGVIQIRPGETLKFDAEKEADIVEKVKALSNSHKLGDLVANLLRIAFESPELLEDRAKLISSVNRIQQLGMSQNRHEYYLSINKEMESLRKKIDEIYSMSYKVYTLALMNKLLNIEKQAENSLMATFILERQVENITRTLGIDSIGHIFESNKLESTKNKAEDVLEYIVNTYSGIVAEIRANIVTSQSDNALLVKRYREREEDKGIIKDEHKTEEKKDNRGDTIEDEEIELVDKRDGNELVINIPTGDRAMQFQRMLEDL